MKLLFILFFTLPSFCQSYRIPPFAFSSETSAPNKYIDLLNLEDENSLVFRIKHIGDGKEMFLVYQNDGKVFTYNLKNSGGESKISKNEVEKDLLQNYWEFLYNCSRTNRYKIDQNKLLTPISSSIIVIDGTTYILEIIQGKKFTSLWSYSPNSYVKTKEDGYQEKKKFWDLIISVENLILNK